MRKSILILVAALSALGIQSCHKIDGNGPIVSESRNISGFNAINAGIDGTIYYTQGPSYNVEIHAQKNIIDILETRVSNGELKIDIDYHRILGRHDPVEIYITSPDITSLALSGSGDIKATNAISTGNMDLKISGSGTITLPAIQASYLHAKISGSGDMFVNGGTVDREKLEISGSGNADMLNVEGRAGETHTSGSGTAKVNLSETLDVHISGSGDVFYKGHPLITTSISGSGKLQPW